MVADVPEPTDPFSPLSGDLASLGSAGSEFSEPKGSASPSFRSGALHRTGVKWAEETSGEARPFQSSLGFYDLDYDPKGKRGVELGKGTSYVEAANVFGRQFTRAELDKDEEGRKLVKLMEAQRTGAYQEEGFWKGLSDFNWGNVPWFGWMMDVGSTVSESISISKAMRKMQDGEPVTNSEAIAVRRFMLQQELESRRSTSYQIGSTIRSSVPFVVEVAGASAMAAMTAKAGLMVGSAIGTLLGPGIGTGIGAAVGGAIGAVGGFVFGGGRLLSKLLTKGVRKGAEKLAVNPMMKGLAGRLFTEGYQKAERSAAVNFAAQATGKSVREIAQAAREVGKTRAYEAVGRELAEKNLGAEAVKDWTSQQFSAYATQNAAKSELRRRTSFEATRWTAESFKDVADLTMDARLAKTFLVNGDVANMVEQGWVQSLERAALAKVYDTVPDRAKDGFWRGIANYWADRAAVRKGLDKLTGEEINNLKSSYLTATMGKALGRPSAVTAVTGSISESLGGQAVSRGYASDVAEHLVNNATRSFMLKYKGTGFVNGAQRVARWVGDGILDGMLRWDTSIYHGAGTIMRSGTVLGGKMAAFKEALKASFVEAPVRGAMQLGMQVPLWPVVSAVTGNGPGDFVVRGQLGIQSTALQTGDREMMDHARAIAIGSGLVEYISESSGRGFNILAEGVAAPTLKNAPFLAATREAEDAVARTARRDNASVFHAQLGHGIAAAHIPRVGRRHGGCFRVAVPALHLKAAVRRVVAVVDEHVRRDHPLLQQELRASLIAMPLAALLPPRERAPVVRAVHAHRHARPDDRRHPRLVRVAVVDDLVHARAPHAVVLRLHGERVLEPARLFSAGEGLGGHYPPAAPYVRDARAEPNIADTQRILHVAGPELAHREVAPARVLRIVARRAAVAFQRKVQPALVAKPRERLGVAVDEQI